MSSPVTIYTTPTCGFCHAAKRLLDSKGINYKEVNLSAEDPNVRQELMERTQHRTVPQIFIGEHFIGGYDELSQLNSTGEFDAKLVAAETQLENDNPKPDVDD